jgi:hypothetical protein
MFPFSLRILDRYSGGVYNGKYPPAGRGNFSQSFFGEKHGKGEEKRRKREKK